MAVMKKVVAIIRDDKMSVAKEAIKALGIAGMTVTEVKGHGKQKGTTEIFHGKQYAVDLRSKIKIEVVVTERDVKKVTDAICEVSRTGSIGDGKIFVSDVEEIIRIRTGETGEEAI
jgi:nitrogen regulatory protein P-II 1